MIVGFSQVTCYISAMFIQKYVTDCATFTHEILRYTFALNNRICYTAEQPYYRFVERFCETETIFMFTVVKIHTETVVDKLQP